MATDTPTAPVANPLDVLLSRVEEVEDELVRAWLLAIRDHAEAESAA